MKFSDVSSQLDEQLNRNIGKQFSRINVGGCGVFAYLLAKELCSIGIDAKVAWLDVYPQSDEVVEVFNNLLNDSINNEINLHVLNANGIRCAHCMVLVDGHYIDGNGVVSKLVGKWERFYHTTTITWEQLQPLAENKTGWNEMFDRKHIPKVKKNIKKVVKSLVVSI